MTCWILIADASRAKVFSCSGRRDLIKLAWEIENPAGRAKAHDLLSDGPGRYSKGGKHGILSAMEPSSPVHQLEEQRFARRLADSLAVALARREYDWLAMFAPSQFLGILRQSIGAEVSKRLVASEAKDFVHLDERDLPAHLPDLLIPPD